MFACPSYRSAVFISALLAGSCVGSAQKSAPRKPAPVTVERISPAVLLPGSVVRIDGLNLVDTADHVLILKGDIVSAEGATATLDYRRPLSTGDGLGQLNADDVLLSFDGMFAGTATVESTNSWGTTYGPEGTFQLEFAHSLKPVLRAAGTGLVYVNSQVQLDAENLLYDTAEGATVAKLDGCFMPADVAGDCATNGTQISVQQVVITESNSGRKRGNFLFAPKLMGVKPGHFDGELQLINVHGDDAQTFSDTSSVSFDLISSQMTGLDQTSVSWGQYLDIRGKGFAGATGGAQMSIRFEGNFTDAATNKTRQVTFEMVPQYVDNSHTRYVIDDKFGLGSVVQVRRETGLLSGTFTPLVDWQGETVVGQSMVTNLYVAGVKQVILIRFTEGWRDSLRTFGLQAADAFVQARIVAAVQETFEGLNIDIRQTEVTDFALYSRVDVSGKDPNGRDMLGYDNTPGKDVGNERLHDWIGGVNALTQQDGYDGYGGIFVESLLSFSEDPPGTMKKNPLHDPLFDQVFDHFRHDKGNELTSAEVLSMPVLEGTALCPAQSRAMQAACAVHILGNLVGHTLAHEVGHSLGLAEPFGSRTLFHPIGNVANRLMDGGGYRPFAERARLQGQGPSVFCDEAFSYLQQILPTGKADQLLGTRPTCD
jgi:hypothetical protein